ncbi:hypothetical protein SLS58_004064 [Diplodia intermedia]|uniref:Uncharacterized protein n=1 Tax=Diplodia intermedia TaxID=856260 RepID=A0ABR3TUK4_9PEZI
MSTTPASEPERKPRQSSVLSVSTQGGDEKSRNARKGSRAKHSWEYVAVDPTEDEAPPPTASRLQKELYSSFTNNFLAGQGRRTRAAAVHASQHFHDHSGSELSTSSHSHPGSESAFSTTTSNTHASPASSPAPPSAVGASRKRKDSAAPTKKAKVSTPAPPVTSDPTSSGATAAQTAPATAEAAAPATAPASSPDSHPTPAVQPAHSVHQDESSVSTTSRAPEGQAKEPAKRKSTVFDDATNKTKASKKADAKPSPAPDSSENRKRKSSPPPEKMAPKVKKAKTSTATTDAAAKSAKAAAAQKRDSLLQEDVYAQQPQQQQTPPWTNTATQNYASHHANQQPTHSKAASKQQHQQQAQQRFSYPPTRAQLADQLEEITHRGIAGGPANYPSIREYRAACAAEAAWQERDQEVVERMLDNPRVIEVLKRLRELNEEIEAERKASKSAGKGHGKGGRKRKVTDDLMDGD